MKTKLILGSLMAFASIVNAQTNTFPTSGNVGIGTLSPGFKLDVQTSAYGGDGIRIKQIGSTGSASLRLENATTGGHNYALFSFGSGDTPGGAGHLMLYDYTDAAYRFMIQGGTGNVGIGTTSPGALLHVQKSLAPPPSSTYIYGTRSDVSITSAVGGGPGSNLIGVSGTATGYNNLHYTLGVYGEGSTGTGNMGGDFIASGGNGSESNYGVKSTSTGNAYNYGFYGSATGGTRNYGIYAEASGGALNWAGYFAGDVNIVGNAYCTLSMWSSDRKLKKDIKPLINSISKIALLKPSSYVFRTDEFKSSNLPGGLQLGLVAQELAEIFPELVSEIADQPLRDSKGSISGTIPGHKVVNYIGLIPVLIGGMQEQQAQIEMQTKNNEDLQTQIVDQQKQLDDQKQLIDALTQKFSGTTGINSINSIETGFQMSQNEPNPFTHETVVKYTLPQTISNAFMAVYDLTGKQITTFPIDQKGSSSITITSEKLAAGIYIYSIVADGKVIDSKRMIVAEK